MLVPSHENLQICTLALKFETQEVHLSLPQNDKVRETQRKIKHTLRVEMENSKILAGGKLWPKTSFGACRERDPICSQDLPGPDRWFRFTLGGLGGADKVD